jgi:hypothetical protein
MMKYYQTRIPGSISCILKKIILKKNNLVALIFGRRVYIYICLHFTWKYNKNTIIWIQSHPHATNTNCQGKFYLPFIFQNTFQGLSWSWSHGSWIYYMYNQCISPLKLWVRTSFMARCKNAWQWLVTGRLFLRVLLFLPTIKLTAPILLKYCWMWR